MTENKPTPAMMASKKPTFEKAEAPSEETTERTEASPEQKVRDSGNGEIDNSLTESNIAWVQGGEVKHGPMPRSEWAAYAKENGL